MSCRSLLSLLQLAWMGTCARQYHRFKVSSTTCLKMVQANTLGEILTRSANTQYGKQHRFAHIKSVVDFRARVPVHEYEDLQPWINRIAEGEDNVLTSDKVIMFEETSGTSSGSKLIPYTVGLQQAFNRALHPWLFDLHLNRPKLWGGPAYWVVTPKTAGRTTSGGVKIGFAADSDYFGSWARPLIKALTVVDESAAQIGDAQLWRYYSLLRLVQSSDLRLISLWNPGFFIAMLRSLSEWSDQLISDLKSGTCSFEHSGDKLEYSFSPQMARAEVLENAAQSLRSDDFATAAGLIWPNLALVSAWSEAEAANDATRLRSIFPEAEFQTKGILATEGAITIPLRGAIAPVLAARSAFFEFEEGEEGAGNLKLAHELETGGRYRLIMTTFAGLFRYRMHDVVEVKGWWHNLPCLAFAGKEDSYSDLCGEKLSSAHVRAVVSRMFPDANAHFLAPEHKNPPYYELFVAGKSVCANTRELENALEKGLCQNFHYQWCRSTKQLAGARVCLLPLDSERLMSLRFMRLEEMKKTSSTAKAGVLIKLADWHDWFISRL